MNTAFTLTSQDIHGVLIQLLSENNSGDDITPTLTVSALEKEICNESGLLNPDECGKTLRVGGSGSLSKKHNYQHILVELLGVAIDPSQLYRKGRYLIYDNIAPTLCSRDYKDPRLVVVGLLDIKGYAQIKRVYSTDGIAPALTAVGGGYQEVKILEPKYYRVRKLTPTEYGRLQAFPMDRWKQVVSNSQAYKQFGNSVTVSVVAAIAKNLNKALQLLFYNCKFRKEFTQNFLFFV